MNDLVFADDAQAAAFFDRLKEIALAERARGRSVVSQFATWDPSPPIDEHGAFLKDAKLMKTHFVINVSGRASVPLLKMGKIVEGEVRS